MANFETHIAEANDFIATLEQSRITGMIVSHGFVVLADAGFALDFTLTARDDGKFEAALVGQCALRSAPMYTRKDAQTLAAAVKDGTGKPGKAMFINDAVDMMQAGQRELIALMEKYAA